MIKDVESVTDMVILLLVGRGAVVEFVGDCEVELGSCYSMNNGGVFSMDFIARTEAWKGALVFECSRSEAQSKHIHRPLA